MSIKCEEIEEFFEFVDRGVSCFHVAENIAIMLERAGFRRLREDEVWKLQPGGSYYVVRNDSSIAAFKIPEVLTGGFHIMAAHSDFPCLKVKENPEMPVEERYIRLNTEKYGGMILSTWLDRPLSLAGRVVVDGENGLETRLVNVDRDLLVIPNVAIHMDRDMNKGVEYNPQTDMPPLFGGIENQGGYLELLAGVAGVSPEEILGSDIYVYNRDKARIVGAKGEYIAAPRLDDLECAFAGVKGLIEARPEGRIPVCVIFDNEEVGSATKQGAGSTFLKDCLRGVCEGTGKGGEDYRRMLAAGFMVSADNAHGLHPNHPEKADATNRPYLNGGIVLKYHGGQKYTTDAYSSAYVKKLCGRLDIPVQSYANRSDIAGGSTLGNISSSQVSIPAADIGLAQLAMHSACETAGAKDLGYLIKFAAGFFSGD